MPGMSEPVTAASALVRVEYHAFHLADIGQHRQPPFRPENGLIFSRPGLAVVLVGASSGVVNVQVQVYEQPVTSPDTTGWDEVVDHSIESVSGQMQVAAMMDDPPDLPLLTPFGPGHYRVRVHARGRDRGYDAVAFEPAEDYLLQIWPATPEKDTVHQHTDQCGQNWRSSATSAPEPSAPPAAAPAWEQQARARLKRASTQPNNN